MSRQRHMTGNKPNVQLTQDIMHHVCIKHDLQLNMKALQVPMDSSKICDAG